MPDPTFDSGEFRRVLGHYPTGVCLVTGHDDDGPIGVIMGSFASVSLDPPLVMFMPTPDADTWQRIEATGSFAVNVLGSDQIDFCVSVFERDPTAWDEMPWARTANGSPVFQDAMAWIDCTVDSVIPAGDHLIVLGKVEALSATADEEASPLLFYKGGYGRFES